MTSGDQTIGGTKTFSSTIQGDISGNAVTVTNGVYTTSNVTELVDVDDAEVDKNHNFDPERTKLSGM